jgi:hypothetical protein
MLADRMKVGENVGRSGKVHELRGGPAHVDIADNLGVVAWAVEGGNVATQLQTAINKTDGVGLVVLQSEQAVSGNRTFGDIMIDELRYDASHRKKTAIDTRIREVVKILKSKKNKKTGKLDYPMLQDVSIKNLDDLAAAHPDMSFDLRGDMFRRIASETHGKTGGIFWRDVMRKVTDYQNKDGYRSGDIVKAIQFEKGDSIVDPKDVGTPAHPSYALAVKGRSLGNIKGRLSAYQVFRDAFNTMGKEKPGRGVSSEGKVGANAYRSMQMRSLTDPIFRQKVGGKSLDVKSYDKPLEFKADSGPKRAELAKRSEINKELGARYMPDNAAYMKAAKKGDTDTAQRMVDQAAKAAGYEIAATHRTSTDDITQFDHSIAQDRLGRNMGLGLGRGKFYFSGRHDGWVNPDNPVNVEAHLKVLNPISEKAYKAIVAEEGGVKDMGDLPGRSRERDAAIAKADAKVKAMGHDGIVQAFRDSDGQIVEYGQIAVFDSNQIKSADPITRDNAGNIIPLSERFQSSSADIRYMPDVGGQDALGMFSAAERATVNLKQETGSASQMLAMIKKGGVKQEELAELGLDQFLEGNRKVTKDEIIDHLVENQVTVEETVLGDVDPSGRYTVRPESEAYNDSTLTDSFVVWDNINNEQVGRTHYGETTAQAEVKRLGGDDPRNLTKHSSYVEPGAVEGSYRELLLRLPKERTTSARLNKLAQDEYGLPWDELLESQQLDLTDETGNPNVYQGGHYGGEYPNTLAHIRFNDRVSDHGKTLNIEEIQSDWHQEGRKKGYREPAKISPLEQQVKELKSEEARLTREVEETGSQEVRDRLGEVYRNRLAAERVLNQASQTTVPDAPFKTSWHELAMKRMIRYAVDNGYDAISWTKGETQFNRYGSQEIAWVRDGDGWKVKATEQRGGETGGIDIEGAARAEGLLREGGWGVANKSELRSIVENTLMDRERGQWSRENFEKQVDKLTDRTWERMQNEDAGTSLPRKEGMEGFYDRMLPKIKTWKKLGLKVEEGYVKAGRQYHTVPQVAGGDGVYFLEGRGPDGLVRLPGTYETAAAAMDAAGRIGTDGVPTHTVRLTPEVKAKVLDSGLARFMPDAAAPNTEKNQLGWSLIKGQGNKWRVYKPDGTLAGIAATKASAERMFRTKYKRELRKGDQSGTARFMPEGDRVHRDRLWEENTPLTDKRIGYARKYAAHPDATVKALTLIKKLAPKDAQVRLASSKEAFGDKRLNSDYIRIADDLDESTGVQIRVSDHPIGPNRSRDYIHIKHDAPDSEIASRVEKAIRIVEQFYYKEKNPTQGNE